MGEGNLHLRIGAVGGSSESTCVMDMLLSDLSSPTSAWDFYFLFSSASFIVRVLFGTSLFFLKFTTFIFLHWHAASGVVLFLYILPS